MTPMLPQTNLQLYRTMIDRGAGEAALVQTRAAYDLARRLFVGSFRPNHKPFVCHLVGVAGALAIWEQPPHVIAAGLLHSACLFGDFGDGAKGATPARRRIVRDCIGAAGESLVQRYTGANWNRPLEQLAAAATTNALDRECLLLKLADLCDECLDAGPRFSPAKPLGFGLPDDHDAQAAALRWLEQLAGVAARTHLAGVFAGLDGAGPPAALVTADRSYHTVQRGALGQPRARIRLRLRRFAQGFGRKGAA